MFAAHNSNTCPWEYLMTKQIEEDLTLFFALVEEIYDMRKHLIKLIKLNDDLFFSADTKFQGMSNEVTKLLTGELIQVIDGFFFELKRDIKKAEKLLNSKDKLANYIWQNIFWKGHDKRYYY
jgi:hypothetical protein